MGNSHSEEGEQNLVENEEKKVNFPFIWEKSAIFDICSGPNPLFQSSFLIQPYQNGDNGGNFPCTVATISFSHCLSWKPKNSHYLLQIAEEPLDLVTIPVEVIHSIVDKLRYQDLANLKECSQSMKKTLSTGNFALQNYVSFVYVNKVRISIPRLG